MMCVINLDIDSSIASVLRKKKKAGEHSLTSVEQAFAELDRGVPTDIRRTWIEQEELALAQRMENPKAMDIYDVQLTKGVFRHGHKAVLTIIIQHLQSSLLKWK